MGITSLAVAIATLVEAELLPPLLSVDAVTVEDTPFPPLAVVVAMAELEVVELDALVEVATLELETPVPVAVTPVPVTLALMPVATVDVVPEEAVVETRVAEFKPVAVAVLFPAALPLSVAVKYEQSSREPC